MKTNDFFLEKIEGENKFGIQIIFKKGVISIVELGYAGYRAGLKIGMIIDKVNDLSLFQYTKKTLIRALEKQTCKISCYHFLDI